MNKTLSTLSTREKNIQTSLIFYLCLCVLLAEAALAQPVRHFPAPTVRSEVPDTLVFCMVFQAMSRNGAILSATNLASQDESIAAAVIAGFENRFHALSDAFDQQLLTREEFILRRDSLVQAARSRLQAKLSPPGAVRLDAFIRQQREKIRAAEPIVPVEN